MKRLITYIRQTLSARLSLGVVSIVTLLFVVTLSVMFYYARQTVKEEAMSEARQALETAALNISNVMQKVEVTANNILWDVEHHLDNPDLMLSFTQRMVETNPDVIGCAIAFEPDFYPKKGHLFMAYHFRQNNAVVMSDHFGSTPYNEQKWYKEPVWTDAPAWIEPGPESRTDGHPITTYSIPVHQDGRVVGVLAFDVSLHWLSQMVLSTRPFPNAFCALMAKDGSFIVHPDTSQLVTGAVFKQLQHWPGDQRQFQQLAKSMMNGESGFMEINFFGLDNYVFYKPFKKTGWSIDIVCPEYELLSGYHRLQKDTYVLIAFGILALLCFCFFFVCYQLAPLGKLDKTVRSIASGHYDETIADTSRRDEIGALQNSFRTMQHSLAHYLAQTDRQTDRLRQHNEELQHAYEQLQKANRVHADFLSNVTDQMTKPLEEISNSVTSIRQNHDRMQQTEIRQQAEIIESRTQIVTDLLDQMLQMTMRKGGDQ